MGLFGNLFGGQSQKNVKEMLANGAVIIDVRTPQEFQGGNVKGSKNIPLDRIENEVKKIKAMNKPVVVCCASGMRSGQAKSILQRHGIEVENAGSWHSL
ncbi:MAG: rhodanese-like domain-containing protein [Crocinitomicaceae bacterium]|nr:rhodanese-like domain-containing protein [Crocinitomicaceae bacterium]MBK8925042.1 rhodanese-like domain-containing protein [Crocinitomicaceae bacterium]